MLKMWGFAETKRGPVKCKFPPLISQKTCIQMYMCIREQAECDKPSGSHSKPCWILLLVHNNNKKGGRCSHEGGCFCRGRSHKYDFSFIPFTPRIIPLIEVEASHVNAAGFWKESIFISLQLACNVPASALASPATTSLNRRAIHHVRLAPKRDRKNTVQYKTRVSFSPAFNTRPFQCQT